jgi:hypothetical protein
MQWVPGAFFQGVKRLGREVDHSTPTSAEVKKIWVYISTPPSPSWCSASLVKYRDNFTLPLRWQQEPNYIYNFSKSTVRCKMFRNSNENLAKYFASNRYVSRKHLYYILRTYWLLRGYTYTLNNYRELSNPSNSWAGRELLKGHESQSEKHWHRSFILVCSGNFCCAWVWNMTREQGVEEDNWAWERWTNRRKKKKFAYWGAP